MSNETGVQAEIYAAPLEKITPELISALCKAQAGFGPALKDANNPFFKSKYAPLDAVWNACKEALAGNDLFVSQPTYMLSGKTMLVTKVYHSSGGFISSEIEVVVSKHNDPQAFGSALTYFRRYELSAILGIVTDDDDAEAAMARDDKKTQPQPQKNGGIKQVESTRQETTRAITEDQKNEILNLLKHPAQQQQDVVKTTDKLPNLTYDLAAQTILVLKKKIALEAEAAAREKAS